jgi:hypothetical protein
MPDALPQTDVSGYAEMGPIQASRAIPPYDAQAAHCKNPNCPNEGEIGMVNYDGCCSVDCRKIMGIDHVDYAKSEMMLVTRDEASQIRSGRAGQVG